MVKEDGNGAIEDGGGGIMEILMVKRTEQVAIELNVQTKIRYFFYFQ